MSTGEFLQNVSVLKEYHHTLMRLQDSFQRIGESIDGCRKSYPFRNGDAVIAKFRSIGRRPDSRSRGTGDDGFEEQGVKVRWMGGRQPDSLEGIAKQLDMEVPPNGNSVWMRDNTIVYFVHEDPFEPFGLRMLHEPRKQPLVKLKTMKRS